MELSYESRELMRLLRRQTAERIAFRVLLDPAACFEGLAAGGREHSETRAPIVWIGRATHQAVGFEPIDELRDIRFHARQPRRQFAERKRLPCSGQLVESRELRERQTDRRQLAVNVAFD